MSIINRENAEAIIRQQVVQSIVQDVPKQSTFLALAKKLPNMTSNQTRIRVLDYLPTSYWVNGDTGYKQTSTQAWDNVYINAAELAVIVPIPEAVLDDAEFDIFGEVIPRVNEAIGQKVDEATIFGIGRPAEWQSDIITLARQAGNNVPVGGSSDYFNLILGENGLFAKVEEDGYMVNGVVSSLKMRSKLRGLKDTVGQPIFKTDMQGSTQYSLDGSPMYFPTNGAFNNSIAQLVAGDFTKAVYAIRQDVTVKILTEATIIDPLTKEILYTLAQQDMVALRVVFRMGWALPNPATRLDEDRVSCPFAYLEPSTPAVTQTVTFTVEDIGDEPIADVAIDVNGARLKTNSSGVAVFNLREGIYPVKIKKNGYNQITESVTVASAAVTKDIVLTVK